MRRRHPGESFFPSCYALQSDKETAISVLSLKRNDLISRLVSFFLPSSWTFTLECRRGGGGGAVGVPVITGHNAPLPVRLSELRLLLWKRSTGMLLVFHLRCKGHSSLQKLLLLLLLIRTRKVQLPSSDRVFPSSRDAPVCTALVAITAGLGGRKDPSWHFMIVRLHFL